ncbi:hypothetical protein M3Y98_00727400 [Aphelenchoides besseyi]|nr:hypothetical protein M3Y98_00727400 [Aphelenchoides besseyi]
MMFYFMVLFAAFSWVSNSASVEDVSTISVPYEINGNTIFCVSDPNLVADAQIRLYRKDLKPGRNLIKTKKPNKNSRYRFNGVLKITSTENFDVKNKSLFWLSIEHTCGGRPYLLVIDMKSFNKSISFPYIILDSIEPTNKQYYPEINFKNVIRGFDQDEALLPNVVRESMTNEHHESAFEYPITATDGMREICANEDECLQ